jgi:DNA-binding CsgD family transcriptional regulator
MASLVNRRAPDLAATDQQLQRTGDGLRRPAHRSAVAHRAPRRGPTPRTPLRNARDIFDALACASWSDRVRRELRASGESSPRRDPDARDQLTAQELQITQLAADGLTNREIGQRLYLSHRTIATHLYRIFPKLGITTRNELRDALTTTPPMP